MVDASGSGRHSRIELQKYLLFGAAVLIAILTVPILVPSRTILEGVPKSLLVTDRHGVPLRLFLAEDDKYRLFRHIADFSPQFVKIVLLQEDRHYYRHPGVNPISLVRAGWQTYVTRKRRIGGSTITMQLARLRYGFATHSILGSSGRFWRRFGWKSSTTNRKSLKPISISSPVEATSKDSPRRFSTISIRILVS